MEELSPAAKVTVVAEGIAYVLNQNQLTQETVRTLSDMPASYWHDHPDWESVSQRSDFVMLGGEEEHGEDF